MHVVIPGNGVRSIPAKNDSSSVIIVDDVVFKPYIVAIQRTDYGSAIIIIHDVIPNYHVMSTCVRIYAVMSAVMYLVVLDNHVAHVHRIKSKIQMVKIIVPYYAAMASIILQPGRHFAPSCFISYVSDVRVGDICSTCCADFQFLYMASGRRGGLAYPLQR